MNWRRFGASAGLVVLANIFVLIGVAYNRSGEPEAEITLTEREVPMSYVSLRSEENTGLALRLQWQRPGVRWHTLMFDPRPTLDWFDQAKLEAVGYDCSLPLSDPSAEQYYGKMLPREVFVVLAYGGKAWTDWLEKWAQDKTFMAKQVEKGTRTKDDSARLNEAYERLPKTVSRLLAVDVGSNPTQLRQRYPERNEFVIIRAEVSLRFVKEKKAQSGEHKRAHLHGEVNLLIDEIHVPFEMRPDLDALFRSEAERRWTPHGPAAREPRYEVTLRFGKRHEPWITAIRPVTTSP